MRVEEKSNGDYISVSSDANNYFLRPLKGELIDKYNKQTKHFGIDILSRGASIVNSVSEGVVVTSDWTKETQLCDSCSTFRGVSVFLQT